MGIFAYFSRGYGGLGLIFAQKAGDLGRKRQFLPADEGLGARVGLRREGANQLAGWGVAGAGDSAAG